MIVALKLKEFNDCEVLLDFTNIDERGEFAVIWDKEEFVNAGVTFTDIEIRDKIEKIVIQSLKNSLKEE
jgi:hypothetical protein